MKHPARASRSLPRRHIPAALASAIALAAVLAAAALTPAARAGTAGTTIRVCNDSAYDATIALVYIPVGEDGFMSEGWFDIGAGDCADVTETDNRTFYVYAESTDGSNRVWTGSHGECVIYPGPYSFPTTDDDTCDDGEELRDFEEIEFDSGTDRMIYHLKD